MRVRALWIVLLAAAVLGPASAARADDLSGARDVLALTEQRLSYMETVAAAKWVSRTPIQDSAQEASVLAGARQLAAERGLNADSVAHLFRAEIEAAKQIQLGWGEQWLLHGFPADAPVADLAVVRPQIARARTADRRCADPHAAHALREQRLPQPDEGRARLGRRALRRRPAAPRDRRCGAAGAAGQPAPALLAHLTQESGGFLKNLTG